MEVKKLMEREQYDEAVRLLDEGIELSKKKNMTELQVNG